MSLPTDIAPAGAGTCRMHPPDQLIVMIESWEIICQEWHRSFEQAYRHAPSTKGPRALQCQPHTSFWLSFQHVAFWLGIDSAYAESCNADAQKTLFHPFSLWLPGMK